MDGRLWYIRNSKSHFLKNYIVKEKINTSKKGQKKLWIAVILSYAFIAFHFIANYLNIEYSSFINGFGIGIIISTVVMLLTDIIQNKVFNKNFWILSMIFMPIMAAIAYMVQRKKLIRLGEGFYLKSNSSTKK